MKKSSELAEIQSKSAKLQIPYETLLLIYVLRQAVSAVSASKKAEHLWLKNDMILNPKNCGQKNSLLLEYVDDEKELIAQDIIGIFQNDEEEEKQFWLKCRAEEEGEQLHLYLTAKIEELQIPAELIVSRLSDDSLKPKEEKLEPLFQKEPEISYLHYPVEGLLSEHFIRILKNLEFLPDLSSYDIVYHLLKNEMNSTRRVTEQIEFLAKQDHVPVEEERFEMVCGLRESPYMKKRWKAYLRGEKKKTPSFEEVMNVLIAYFWPLWEALERGSYYLGDWMPELERFLD